MSVDDNEYPPVRKNTAMLKFASSLAAEKHFDWILKVDDDTYVAVDSLVNFVGKLPEKAAIFMGRRGIGRPEDRGRMGLESPYCQGGPGYLLSAVALAMVAPKFESCVKEADASMERQFVFHSDVVIGKCVTQHCRIGCWEGRDIPAGQPSLPEYMKTLFTHFGEKDPNNMSWPSQFVTVHPMKTLPHMLSAQISHSENSLKLFPKPGQVLYD